MTSRTANEPKMLRWLAAQGVKAHGIQKEWQIGCQLRTGVSSAKRTRSFA